MRFTRGCASPSGSFLCPSFEDIKSKIILFPLIQRGAPLTESTLCPYCSLEDIQYAITFSFFDDIVLFLVRCLSRVDALLTQHPSLIMDLLLLPIPCPCLSRTEHHLSSSPFIQCTKKAFKFQKLT